MCGQVFRAPTVLQREIPMQYDYLIFDADHTVIDFDADERRAFRAAFAAAGMDADPDMVETCWAFSARNWGELGLNDVHLPELRARYHALYHTHVRDIMRFADAQYGLGAGRAQAEKVFSEALSRPAHPVEGAVETLTALRKRVRAVADKYAHMDGVALVSHGMDMRTLRTMHDVGYAEIVELDYSPDMPDCVYWDE